MTVEAAFFVVLAVALVASAWIAWSTWRAMGPAGEVMVRDAVGPRRLSTLAAMAPFAFCAVVAGMFVVVTLRTGQVFPPIPLAIAWFAGVVAMQLGILLKARRRRVEVKRKREALFGA